MGRSSPPPPFPNTCPSVLALSAQPQSTPTFLITLFPPLWGVLGRKCRGSRPKDSSPYPRRGGAIPLFIFVLNIFYFPPSVPKVLE